MDFRSMLRQEREKFREKRSFEQSSNQSDENESRSPNGQLANARSDPNLSHDQISFPPFKFPFRKREIGRNSIAQCIDIPTVHYLPEWITKDEEEQMLEQTYHHSCSLWTCLRSRRLQLWGKPVPDHTKEHSQSANLSHMQYLPLWMQRIADVLVESGVFPSSHPPNQVLLNEYCTGQGILPHQDGPKYYPYVVILTLGAQGTMSFQAHRRFWKSENQSAPAGQSLLLEPRSLLIFTDVAYEAYLHSIEAIEKGKRVSLTIRHVL